MTFVRIWLIAHLLSAALATAEERFVISPELQDLWEQIYNEPGQTFNAARSRLLALPKGTADEETAVLHAIAAEAASFAEKNEECLFHGEAAEKLASAGRYYWPWIHALSALGMYYEFNGKSEKAHEHYEKAVTVARTAQDSELIAYSLNNLGYYYGRNRGTKDAIRVVIDALRLLEDLPHGPLYHDVMNNLGMIYSNNELAGRMAEGRKLLEQSFAYFKARQMRYMTGNNYINLGLFYGRTNESVEAIKTFQEAIEYSRANHIDDLLPYYESHLADILNNAGRHEEALKLAESAIALYTQFKNNSMLSATLITKSQAQISLKRAREALDTIRSIREGSSDLAGGKGEELVLDVEIRAWNQLGDMPKELQAMRRWAALTRKLYDQKTLESTLQVVGLFELERKDAQNKLLEEKNQANTQRLEQANRISRILMGLLLCFGLLFGVMLLALRQSRVIRLQRNRMQEILGNIEEGILRFGRDFKVEADFSSHLAQILDMPSDLSGRDACTLLFEHTDLTADAQSTIRSALSSILEEGELAWSLNSSQLPHELQRGHRILNLLWQPHYDHHQKVDKIMVVVRDVTSSRVLEAEIQATRRENQAITRILQEMLAANTRSLQRFMAQLPDLRTERPSKSALHTLKGDARTLGLTSFAEAVHRLESALLHDLPQDEARHELQRTIERFKQLHQDMFHKRSEQRSSLLALVDEITPALLQQLGSGHIPFGSIRVDDGIGQWPESLMNPLRIMLLHGLSNAIDHGYVLPQKMEPAQLAVEARVEGRHWRLTIRDRGVGIRWHHLERLAQERHFRQEAGRPLTDVLFLSEVSTAAQATLSSGRGVGLTAIREACTTLGADVALLDNDQGPGSMLVIDFPDDEPETLSA